MDRIEFLKEVFAELNRAFGRATTSLSGWAGGILLTYFSPGTVGITILGLQVAKLATGTILALKISRLIKNKNLNEDDYPEIVAMIRSGKKKPFNWREWGLWLEQLAVTFVLVGGCETFKFWLSHGKAWLLPGLEILVGVIYFVIIFTTLRSCVRNTALVTQNGMLLWVWKWMGVNADFKIKEYLDPQHLLHDTHLPEETMAPKQEPVQQPIQVEIVNLRKEDKNDATPEFK